MAIPKPLVAALNQSTLTLAVTGSGISADSGIPTFRDAQTGIWSRFRPEDLATPEAFESDPKRVWEWYAWRRKLVAKAQPNPGHQALADLEAKTKTFELVTQNVDGLHQRAGSKSVIEFHGNITRNKCFRRHTPVTEMDTSTVPPTCPCCGGWVRPDVVWFGEGIDETKLNRSFQLAGQCDVFLSIGTSSQVYPAAGLIEIALESDAVTIEINPNRTPFSGMVDFYLEGSAAEVLPEIVSRLPTSGPRLPDSR